VPELQAHYKLVLERHPRDRRGWSSEYDYTEYLDLQCGMRTCRLAPGRLVPATRQVTADDERMWAVSAPETYSQRQPAAWAMSRFSQRSARHAPHRSPRPAPRAVPASERWHVAWFDGQGRSVADDGGWKWFAPVAEDYLAALHEVMPNWDGKSRLPRNRHIATLVPPSLSQPLDALSARGHPRLARLTIACPVHGHVNVVRYEKAEEEAASQFSA
jgi:hypothetical protein